MKTLLLSLGLLTSAVFAASASPVYSDNIIGYYYRTLPPGLSMFANQLNASNNNNRVTNLIPSPPGPITVSKFNRATGNFDLAVFDLDAGGWSDPTGMVLNPGQGAFIDNATGGDLALLFVGEVQLTANVSISAGLGVYSSPLPIAGDLDALGFPTTILCQVSLFRFNGRSFDTALYDPDVMGWSPAVPRFEVGESFFADSQCTIAWQRVFPVGP